MPRPFCDECEFCDEGSTTDVSASRTQPKADASFFPEATDPEKDAEADRRLARL
jgi:hypothetical protein